MEPKIALIFYYHKLNRNSVNALAGAIEIHGNLKSIEIFFPRREKKLFKTLKKVRKKGFEKIIIAFSISTPQFWDIQKMVEKIRNQYKKNKKGIVKGEEKSKRKLLVIAGGPHPTARSRETLEAGFDIVVRGEGEWTFPELLEHILLGKQIQNLPGISFFNPQNILIENPPPPLVDLDDYPPYSKKYDKRGHIEITRGCPFACYFCQTPSLFGAKLRHRSLDNICNHIVYLKSKGFTDFRFISPNGFLYGSRTSEVNYKKLEEFFKRVSALVKPEGRIFFGSFPTEVRPENVNQRTIDLVKKYAANRNLIIGAQSGSNAVLQRCHRGHSVEEVMEAVTICHQNGITSNIDIIFGLPQESEEEALETIEFIRKLIKKGAKIHAHSFVPLPGTPFQYKKPSPINEKVRKEILTLIGDGKLYGDWQKQEKMGEKIVREFEGNEETL